MKNRYSYGQSLINNLVDERRYEFTLTGKFEDVIGNSLKILFFFRSLAGLFTINSSLIQHHVNLLLQSFPPSVSSDLHQC